MRSGQLTARSVAEQYLARIESIDRSGPSLRSVIETNPDALSIADALDRERKEKGPRGPMHGIPVLIKDNIDTADRMKTTAGSLALADAPQPRDAAVVERLRASGAVILGKTNLSRMGQLPLHSFHERLERTWRADSQPLCARSQSVRLQLRLGRGGGSESLRGRGGYRNRWLGGLPILDKRDRGHQADSRAGGRARNRADRAQPGHRRPDGTHGARLRHSARCDGRWIARPTDYTKYLDPQGLRGVDSA